MVRHIAHQVPHQGLGDGAVHPVHGHMVAVIGGPAQGQLRQVAGADDNAPQPVGRVHQHLGALPRLRVLIGHVQVGFPLADVQKVLAHRFLNGNLPEADLQLFRNALGVGLGPAGGAEAGHGQGVDALPGQPQPVERPGCDQQRQGGVQPAGKAHHRHLAVDGRKPGGQAHALHGQDQLAAVGKPHRVPGHKGCRGKFPLGLEALQGALLIAEGDAHHLGVLGGMPTVHPAALLGKALQVHVGGNEASGKQLALCQQRAVFRNQVVARKHHIRGGLSQAAVHIGVGSQQPAGVLPHQLPAVLRLADGFIAARGVQDHRGPV